MKKLTAQEILYYEVSSSYFAGITSIKWLQELLAKYFGWKVNRKYKRYLYSLEMAEQIKKYHDEN